MRSDLEKLPGISDIKTDVPTNIATFKLAATGEEVDLKAKLDEFAKTNEHMADWSFIEAKDDKKKDAEKKS